VKNRALSAVHQQVSARQTPAGLLLLVTVFAQTLFPLVGGNLVTLSLFTARHELEWLRVGMIEFSRNPPVMLSGWPGMTA
jgi:hypothetical protein